MRDLYNNLKYTQVTIPAVTTANVTSAKADMQGFGSLVMLFDIGLSGDTLSGTVYWTLTLQESDDDSTYTNVAASDMFGSASIVIDDPSEDEKVYAMGYRGKKRYIKALATKTGTHTTGTPIGIIAVQGKAANKPVL